MLQGNSKSLSTVCWLKRFRPLGRLQKSGFRVGNPQVIPDVTLVSSRNSWRKNLKGMSFLFFLRATTDGKCLFSMKSTFSGTCVLWMHTIMLVLFSLSCNLFLSVRKRAIVNANFISLSIQPCEKCNNKQFILFGILQYVANYLTYHIVIMQWTLLHYCNRNPTLLLKEYSKCIASCNRQVFLLFSPFSLVPLPMSAAMTVVWGMPCHDWLRSDWQDFKLGKSHCT